MAIGSKKFTIDDLEYETENYLAMKAVKLGIKLSKIGGGSMAMIMSSGGLEAKITPEFIGQVVESVVLKLDEDESEIILREILSTTYVMTGGKRMNVRDIFNTHFSGQLGHLFKVLGEVLSFQYDNFFAVLVGASEVLRSAVDSKVVARGGKTKKANSRG